MAAMVVRLKESRPANLGSVSGFDRLPVAAADAEPFSADTAADTMNRLKRQTAVAEKAFRQQSQQLSPETQRYLSSLESTVGSFQTINVQLVDSLKSVSKKMEQVGENVVNEVMHHVEWVDRQASTQQKTSVEALKAAVFGHFKILNHTLDRMGGRAAQMADVVRDDVRGHVVRLNQTLDDKFQRLDHALDDKIRPLEQVGQAVQSGLEPFFQQTVEKMSNVLNETATALQGHQNRTRDHVTAFVGQQLGQHFERLNKTLDKKFWQLDLTASNLKPLFGQTVEKMSALLNDTAQTLEAGGNQTRDHLVDFIDQKLGQLRDNLVADLVLTNAKPWTEDQMEAFFNQKTAQWTLDVNHRTEEAENRTRDWLNEGFDRVDAQLAAFQQRFDYQDVLLNDSFKLTTHQSALMNKCLEDGLKGKPIFTEYWNYVRNLWHGTVPENSALWHPQTLWDLLDSQQVLLWILGVGVYFYRFGEDRVSSYFAKKWGVRPHFLTKVFIASSPMS